jgi:DNA polymerase III subunit gamma/tau
MSTLYRKYRPNTLSDLIGQEHIVTVLQNAVDKQRIAHAYLFTGTRGTGKTTVARIFARLVNGIDPSDLTEQLDIIEIDAASNRRIDEIRDLKERVALSPVSAKYKVYIVDEVHMLTKEAFNALLKTLEEPPAHVIFILATTDFHKLPATIVSRTQRLHFRDAKDTNLIELLTKVCKSEKITYQAEALKMIAALAKGSYRDALSLLGQLRGHDQEITADLCIEILGMPDDKIIGTIVGLLEAGDGQQAANLALEQTQNGIRPQLIGEEIIKSVLSKQPISSDMLTLADRLIATITSQRPELSLQLALMSIGSVAAKITTPSMTSKMVEKIVTKDEPKTVTNIAPKLISTDLAGKILELAEQQAKGLYTILRMCQFQQTDSTSVHMVFRFPFHLKQATTTANSAKISTILAKAMGLAEGSATFTTAVGPASVTPVDEAEDNESEPQKTDTEVVAKITDVFGTVEMLQ